MLMPGEVRVLGVGKNSRSWIGAVTTLLTGRPASQGNVAATRVQLGRHVVSIDSGSVLV
jgi:hypothetical protein